MKGVLVALCFVDESNLLLDLWLNCYVYDKLFDSSFIFAPFTPSICLIHLKLFRSYNSTIEWKGIKQRSETGKSRKEEVWFSKMNNLCNFVTDLQFFKNHITITSTLTGSSFYERHNFFGSLFYSDKREFVNSYFSDSPFCFAIFFCYIVVLFCVGRHGESYHYLIGVVKMCATIID